MLVIFNSVTYCRIPTFTAPRKLQHGNCCQSVSNTAHYIHFMVVSKLRLNKVSMVCIILCVPVTKWTGTCTHTYTHTTELVNRAHKRWWWGGEGYSCMLLSTWQLHYNYGNQIFVLSCNTANYENFHYNGEQDSGTQPPKKHRKGSKENANRSGLFLWLVSTAK